jgi:hypothetical protein
MSLDADFGIGPAIGFASISICNKCGTHDERFFDTFNLYRARHVVQPAWRAARRTAMKKVVSFIVAAALGAGLATAAQAHVSIGVGIGVPLYAPPPVYYAPPPPVYYAPPPPVYYAPPVYYGPPAVVVGGYYGRPYWHHGYYGRPYWRR